ncbi:hypothetical protein [Rhizobium sp. NLR22b]|uniref:hypothetical protein n=1 Tax=Rhizobium sp. NLR22b TaxID=2731115 RepID=UPI001C83394F|nr:hypothetical protein [Rhizobium sp. NLR22b]MBX5242881.1 hypothetical protein [Rhizobium sp. NLR22b]
MEAAFCIEAVEFQFGLTATVRAWTMSSSSRRAVEPSSRRAVEPSSRRALERFWRSIKYEEVYLHAYRSVSEAGEARYLTSDYGANLAKQTSATIGSNPARITPPAAERARLLEKLSKAALSQAFPDRRIEQVMS